LYGSGGGLVGVKELSFFSGISIFLEIYFVYCFVIYGFFGEHTLSYVDEIDV